MCAIGAVRHSGQNTEREKFAKRIGTSVSDCLNCLLAPTLPISQTKRCIFPIFVFESAPGSADPAQDVPVWKSAHLQGLLQSPHWQQPLKLLQRVLYILGWSGVIKVGWDWRVLVGWPGEFLGSPGRPAFPSQGTLCCRRIR